MRATSSKCSRSENFSNAPANNVEYASGITLKLKAVNEAIVEENLISIGETPDNPDATDHISILRDSTVLKMKTFNNQSRAGVFLGCWNTSASRLDGVLVTDIEAAIIGL